MTQSRLGNLGMSDIEHEATQNINSEEVISDFAAANVEKKMF